MNADDLTERLDLALDAVLAVRVTLARGVGPALPEDLLGCRVRLTAAALNASVCKSKE